MDIELLRILVNGIKNNLIQCDMTTLKKEALQLMGRLTSLVSKKYVFYRNRNGFRQLNSYSKTCCVE